ncbi:MAG TPA: L,D-transpeptidase family protein [Actinomycetales bacterium]|nr:L,D-transpeptidase family protein [Actinomycetales bacterium]
MTASRRSSRVLGTVLVAVVGSAVVLAGCASRQDRQQRAAPTTSVTVTMPTTHAPSTSTSAPTATSAPSTSKPSPTTTTRPAPSQTSRPPSGDETLGAGDSGPAVLALQKRLSELGYWLGQPDGEFGLHTTQAVYALQGAAGLQRDGRVGPRTRAALDKGVRPKPRSGGTATEIDLDRGLLIFVHGGRVARVLHTSTGTFQHYVHDGRTMLADTPRGSWSVNWAQNGWREGDLGRLYRPRYFHPDGVAVHGYTSVPAYPASHGCARVSLAAMDMIWSQNLMPIGSKVLVY